MAAHKVSTRQSYTAIVGCCKQRAFQSQTDEEGLPLCLAVEIALEKRL
jgi:hypothetical protein